VVLKSVLYKSKDKKAIPKDFKRHSEHKSQYCKLIQRLNVSKPIFYVREYIYEKAESFAQNTRFDKVFLILLFVCVEFAPGSDHDHPSPGLNIFICDWREYSFSPLA
jgi:hypothetical protein